MENLREQGLNESLELNKQSQQVEKKLTEANQACKEALAKASSFQEKFDAQKPVLDELTVQLADKDLKLDQQTKQLDSQRIEL